MTAVRTLISSEIVTSVLLVFAQRLTELAVVVGEVTHTARVVAGREPGRLGLRIPALADDATHPFTCRVELSGTCFALTGALVPAGDVFAAELSAMACVEARRVARVRLAPGTAQLAWRAGDRRRTAEILDLGPDGVQLAPAAELPDTAFSAELTIAGQAFAVHAEPRHARGGDGGAGVALAPAGRDARIAPYLALRFPRLRPRRDIDADAVQALFERSGYLALRPGTRPAPSWFAIDDDRVSRDMVYAAASGPVGHISISRAYPQVWVAHQLATVSGHAETAAARAALYLFATTIPPLIDGGDAMMMGYYDRGKRWHQVFFESFVRWIADDALALGVAFDRFERAAGAAADPPPALAGVEVGPLRADERAAAVALIRGQLPVLAADAFDIAADRLDAACLHPAYAVSRYARARHALALRVDGALAGVALCETASPELSLFHLMTMAQVFVRPDPAPPLAGELALLHAIRGFYAARGVAEPLVIAPPGSFRAAAEPGTYLAETMGCFLCAGRALRQYHSFLSLHLGARA